MSKFCSGCGKEILIGNKCLDCVTKTQEKASILNYESDKATAARKKTIKDTITITLSIMIPLIIICILSYMVMYNRAQTKKKTAQENILINLAVEVEGDNTDYCKFNRTKYEIETNARNLFDIETASNSSLIKNRYTKSALRAHGGYKESLYYLKSKKASEQAGNEYFHVVLNKNDEVIRIGYYYSRDTKLSKTEITSNLLKILCDEFSKDNEFLERTLSILNGEKYTNWDYEDISANRYIGFCSNVPYSDDYMNDYVLSDNGYRRFTTKSETCFKRLINNAPKYGWTVNRNTTVKNSSQKDRLVGIINYVNLTMEKNNGDRGYLRVFCDVDSKIVQMEFYADKKYLGKDIKKMLVNSLFEDFVSDYKGDNLSCDTWSIWNTSTTEEFDDIKYKAVCIGVKQLEPMSVSSLYSTTKDFRYTSNGGFSFKAHISNVSWGNSSVSYSKSYYSDPTVYMELIFTVMDSQGRNLGTLTGKVDIDSSALTDYVHYTGKGHEFIFVCDSHGNLVGLPQKV